MDGPSKDKERTEFTSPYGNGTDAYSARCLKSAKPMCERAGVLKRGGDTVTPSACQISKARGRAIVREKSAEVRESKTLTHEGARMRVFEPERAQEVAHVRPRQRNNARTCKRARLWLRVDLDLRGRGTEATEPLRHCASGSPDTVTPTNGDSHSVRLRDSETLRAKDYETQRP